MASRSALMAAAARAAHLEVDQPPYLFEDTLAMRLLGDQAEDLLSYHRKSGSHPALMGTRLAVTARARYAEDRLAEAVSDGVAQYVILGAGLDSFAFRSPLMPHLTLFELDEPDTLNWKLDVLRKVGLEPRASHRLIPADLGADALAAKLADGGFDSARPAFVSWLGVTMYLSREAITSTLRALGRLAPGSRVVFDHALPPDERDAAGKEYASFAEAVGAANGEPWITPLGVEQAGRLLEGAGLEPLAQPLLAEWVSPELWNRTDAIKLSILWAMAYSRPLGSSRASG